MKKTRWKRNAENEGEKRCCCRKHVNIRIIVYYVLYSDVYYIYYIHIYEYWTVTCWFTDFGLYEAYMNVSNIYTYIYTAHNYCIYVVWGMRHGILVSAQLYIVQYRYMSPIYTRNNDKNEKNNNIIIIIILLHICGAPYGMSFRVYIYIYILLLSVVCRRFNTLSSKAYYHI